MADNEPQIVRLRQLGLAAYLTLAGCKLLRIEKGQFIIETSKSLDEWKVDYANSCCSRHDAELCKLRKFITK